MNDLVLVLVSYNWNPGVYIEFVRDEESWDMCQLA